MKRTTNGFTLIEMLVVVAVIGILAAMIHSGVSKTIERAKIANTRTLVMAIDNGLQLFKTDFGHLPYDGGSKTNLRKPIRLWLTGLKDNGEPDTSGVRGDQLWTGPYVEIQIRKHLDEDDNYVFVDSWGQPIYFETDPNGTEDMVFNPDRWDIWSLGPDEAGTTDMGTISGSSYKIKRDNFKEHTVGNKEVNRDNIGNW
jgi:general secretion pathway protein G